MSSGPSKPKSILKSRPSPSGLSDKAGPSSASRTAHQPAKGSKLRHSVQIKRSRPQKDSEGEDDSDGFDRGDMSVDEDEGGAADEGGQLGTDDELEASRAGAKGKKPLKRKRPPTDASTFGSTLTSLLTAPAKPANTKKPKSESSPAPPAPSASAQPKTHAAAPPQPQLSAQQTILSLSSRLPPSAQALALERKAAREVKRSKEEREDRARVKDVAEGWGPAPVHGGAEPAGQGKAEQVVLGGGELEKVLRKTAQRGVIKLFNAILQAARTSEAASTPVPSEQPGLKHLHKLDDVGGRKGKGDVALGRAGKEALTKEGFLDLVRRG